MSQPLRYQITNWDQVTECFSNNSKNLYLTISKLRDNPTIRGDVIKVNHTKYGVLFAAILNGDGKLLNTYTEDYLPLPFMSTQMILRELERFGFIIKYDVKNHLPADILTFLSTVDNLGYDKITKVCLETKFEHSAKMWLPTTIIMKSRYNDDLLTYGCRISRKVFEEKLTANVVMNIEHEANMSWDWVTYIANIEDILSENANAKDTFSAISDDKESNFTPYVDSGD